MSDLIDRIKGLRYVHVPQASQLFEEAIAEIERLRLTDAEREAIQWAVGWIKSSTPNGHCPKPLCDLLERMTL